MKHRAPQRRRRPDGVSLAVLHEGKESQTAVLTYVTDSAYSSCFVMDRRGN